jgi:hypothetical protein
VVIEVNEHEPKTLVIRPSLEGDIIAKHECSTDKGKLIQNRHHIRDRSQGLGELEQQLNSRFQHPPKAAAYLEEIRQRYPRYRRDQLAIMDRVVQQYPAFIDAALARCMAENLYSANHFRDVARYLQRSEHSVAPEPTAAAVPPVIPVGMTTSTRALHTYTKILGGQA